MAHHLTLAYRVTANPASLPGHPPSELSHDRSFDHGPPCTRGRICKTVPPWAAGCSAIAPPGSARHRAGSLRAVRRRKVERPGSDHHNGAGRLLAGFAVGLSCPHRPFAGPGLAPTVSTTTPMRRTRHLVPWRRGVCPTISRFRQNDLSHHAADAPGSAWLGAL
jgi:hypothetical protein